MYVTPNSPLIVTVTGATPVRCSLIFRTVLTERTKATVVRFELLLELTALTPLDSVFISHSSNDKDFSRPSL